MHPLDLILLFSIANVVAWPVSLYIDDDPRRVIGHLLTCATGSVVLGLLAQAVFPDGSKFVLIFGGFAGAMTSLYVVRFKKWK